VPSKNEDLPEVLVEHQVPVQALEVEQVLHRLPEVLVLEDRRLQVHVEAVDARRHVDEDRARRSQPLRTAGNVYSSFQVRAVFS
jgi:hypothetical protein